MERSTFGAALTKVVLFTQDGQEDRIGTFFNGAFACDDVAYTYEKLKGRGVDFEAPPTKQPWGNLRDLQSP